jgi:hypothetical protein
MRLVHILDTKLHGCSDQRQGAAAKGSFEWNGIIRPELSAIGIRVKAHPTSSYKQSVHIKAGWPALSWHLERSICAFFAHWIL